MNCFITRSMEMEDISRFKKKWAVMGIQRFESENWISVGLGSPAYSPSFRDMH